MSSWWLVVTGDGATASVVVPLAEGKTVIGSSDKCNLILRAPKVSRQHLLIERKKDEIVAEDLGSSTGTLLNGTPLKKASIEDGALLSVVNYQISITQNLPKARASSSSTKEHSTLGWEAFRVFMDELVKASDPEKLVNKLLGGLVSMLAAERGFVLLRQEEGDELLLVASHKLSHLTEEAAVSNTVCAAVMKRGHLLAVADSSLDQRCAAAESLALLEAPRAIVCSPLKVADKEAFGAIYVDMEKTGSTQTFTKEKLHLFEMVIGLASELIAAKRVQLALAATKGKLAEFSRLSLGEDEMIMGEEPADKKLWEMIEAAAQQEINVFITGDTGTGKEMVARALHKLSPRKNEPFIAVNCSAIPHELVEAELFGVEKGAYTGAGASRPGRFELANGGTLFLDEIGDLPLAEQVKLLRALQERTITRVGGTKAKSVDIRIIAATNVNIEEKVNEGAFRQDLYYRLNVFRIVVPQLRLRTETLAKLSLHFLQMYARRFNKSLQGIEKSAQRVLREYSWPGNIRELRNVIERAVVIEKGEQLTTASLSFGSDARVVDGGEQDMHLIDLPQDYEQANALFTRAFLQRCLERNEGNIRAVSRETGIPRNTLYRIMKRLDMR